MCDSKYLIKYDFLTKNILKAHYDHMKLSICATYEGHATTFHVG